MYRKEYNSLVSDLATECQVSCYDLYGHTHTETCWGIWDTGSYRTVISTELANRLGVNVEQTTHRVNAIKSSQAAGMAMVNIRLEDLYFPFLRVLVIDYEVENHPDILIGMDIICQGCLEVVSLSGNTIVSFDVRRDKEGNPILQTMIYDD